MTSLQDIKDKLSELQTLVDTCIEEDSAEESSETTPAEDKPTSKPDAMLDDEGME
jgi:hypothetical protein